jgi:hypothetical protein
MPLPFLDETGADFFFFFIFHLNAAGARSGRRSLVSSTTYIAIMGCIGRRERNTALW